jgi:two-component sensor histidine kinase
MGRVTAVARIHERLYRPADIGTIDLASYLADICQDLAGLSSQREIKYQPDGPISIATDRAVRVALLVTELVTNAAKHAHSEGRHGQVNVKLTRADKDAVRLSVCDEGAGLATDSDIERSAAVSASKSFAL